MRTRLVEITEGQSFLKVRDTDTSTGVSSSYFTDVQSFARMFGQTFHLGWIESSEDGIVYFSLNNGCWDFVVQIAGRDSFKTITAQSRDGVSMKTPWVYHVIRLVREDNLSGGFRRQGEVLLVSPSRVISPDLPVFSAYNFFPHVSVGFSLNSSNICWGTIAPNTLTPSNLVNVTRSFLTTTFTSGHYTNFTNWKEYSETGSWPSLQRTTLSKVLKGIE